MTAGVFQTTFAGHGSDGFLAEFQPGALPSLIYCSYLGTNANGRWALAAWPWMRANALYRGIHFERPDGFPVKNAFQTAYGGDPSDAFLMKILPGQGAADLIYATLLGGSGLDEALAVAVDDSMPANAYVTGTTVIELSDEWHYGRISTALHFGCDGKCVFLGDRAKSEHRRGHAGVFDVSRRVAERFGAGLVSNRVQLGVRERARRIPGIFPGTTICSRSMVSSDAFVAKFDPSSAGAASLLYATPLGGTAPRD